MALTSLDKDNINRLLMSLNMASIEAARRNEIVQHNATACGQLSMLVDQMKMLQTQAETIVTQATTSHMLHKASCMFAKVKGKVYHFYKNNDGGVYCSMLSPHDWKGNPPHEYYGSYTLHYDNEFYKVDISQST